MQAQVKKIEENRRSYQSKHGEMFVHEVYLDGDPEPWEYHSKTKECAFDKFSGGYTTDVSQNGKYTNRKISPVFDTKPVTFKKGGKVSDKPQEVITALSAASSAATFYNQKSGTEDQVLGLAEKIYNWAMGKSPK